MQRPSFTQCWCSSGVSHEWPNCMGSSGEAGGAEEMEGSEGELTQHHGRKKLEPGRLTLSHPIVELYSCHGQTNGREPRSEAASRCNNKSLYQLAIHFNSFPSKLSIPDGFSLLMDSNNFSTSSILTLDCLKVQFLSFIFVLLYVDRMTHSCLNFLP